MTTLGELVDRALVLTGMAAQASTHEGTLRAHTSAMARLAAASIDELSRVAGVEQGSYLRAVRQKADELAVSNYDEAIALITAALDGDPWLLGFALDAVGTFEPALLAAMANIAAGNVLALEERGGGRDGLTRMEALALDL